MILLFPDFATLQLAVTSATLPEEILRAPAVSATDGEKVFVQFEAKLSRADSASIKALGAQVVRKSPLKLTHAVTCWHQLVPLVRDHAAESVSDKTAVLFVTHHNQQLAELVSEMMRLGNDRQSFRFLKGKAESTKAMLRVVGPPYYSLLRAIDPGVIQNSNEDAKRAIAFVERKPRIWVQFGFQHPLLDQVQAPVGQQLMMRVNGEWEFLDEAPFQDVYKALETSLPSVPGDLVESQLPSKIPIPLSLANAASNELAGMWVIREKAMEQVESLVRSSDNQLISRLSFAVAGSGDSTTVIIRVRPSKDLPPCLVLDAVAYRSYLKLPNLFLPVGKRLHPPLRRDAVSKLLAFDSKKISWLAPDQNPNSFQTLSIKDSAFQPLSNWVNYVTDREAESLQAWSDSFQFEFESFVCHEDAPRKPKPPRVDRGNKKSSESAPEKNKPTVRKEKVESRNDFTPKQDAIDTESIRFVPEETSEQQYQVQLAEIETTFVDLDEPADSAGRRELWRQMAPLNANLGRRHDATVCWSNSVWDAPDEDCGPWMKSEATISQLGKLTDAKLEELIAEKSNRPKEISLVASYLAWASQQNDRPEFVQANIGELTQYLQRQENFLPIRTAWIAWHSLYQLSDGDVLLLARARDRILERLFQNGLTPEYDMPSFLRLQGTSADERYRTLSEQIRALSEVVYAWIEAIRGAGAKETVYYTRLMFAFAHARLGDIEYAQSVMEEAAFELDDSKDAIHKWFAKAFEERIVRAMNADTLNAPFSEKLIEIVDSMERMDRYKVDRLRQQSRILEPLERINPFTRWHEKYSDELSQQLSNLPKIADREELRGTIAAMLKKHRMGTPQRNRILGASLQLAPRTGEVFGMQLVDYVIQSLRSAKASVEDALLLQKSMFVSAHFGRGDAVRELVNHFEKSLPNIVSSYLGFQVQHNSENLEKVKTIELLFTESFHELRKLGMRDEIGRLYARVLELVEKNDAAGRKKRTARNSKVEVDATRPLRLLLCVAGGWYYFGRYEEADEIVDQVKTILLKNELTPLEQKGLAAAYVKAVAMAPPDQANSRILELFKLSSNGDPELQNIKDSMTTSSHYSISQLALVESTVLALVNDEYSLNADSRRWLDEDEFLVRSRIHRDVQQATQ
jgi:hypothetical protein